MVFMKDNQIRFEAVMQKVEALNKKYFVIIKDADGKETLDMREGKPVLIEGMTEESFQNELNEFFKTPSSVII